ncbi:hypothetical protein pdam_00018364, partial [Pocillopora damicornis]
MEHVKKKFNQPISFTVFTEQWFPYHACAGRGTVFYTVMTRGTKEYKGKAQFWFGSKPQVVYCFDVSNPIFDICIIQRKKESFHYTILYVTRDCYSREIIVVMTDDKT